MRKQYREASLFMLFTISLLILSTAIDSVGQVPTYYALPRPPFLNQSKASGNGEAPFDWDISSSLDKQVTEINASCGCESIPLFNITGITGTEYIRVKIGESYDRKWYMYNEDPVEYNGETIQPRYNGQPYTIYIEPEMPITNYLPTVLYPYQIRGIPTVDYYPEKMVFQARTPINELYKISYNVMEYEPSELTDAFLQYNVRYLQVPYDVQIQVENMTKEIVMGIESDYLKIKAIESYLLRNYRYNDNYTSPPEGADPIIWFIDQSKEGVCIHFNSALVLMARSIGLPMRLVTGFSVNPAKHTQTVKPDQAHAWAEAYFRDIGWVTFDATPQNVIIFEPEVGGLQQTSTNITNQDTSCYKENNFTISGIVKDQGGVPVPGLTTLIYLKQNKNETGALCGKTITQSTGFTVNCSIPLNTQPGIYNVEAITLSNRLYNWSSSDPPLIVRARSYLEYNITQRVIANRWISLEGNLLETITKTPIFTNFLEIITAHARHVLSTNADGLFRFNNEYSPGINTVNIYWEGDLFYNGTSASFNITAVPLSITPDPLTALARGEDTEITGRVHAMELIPSSGERVDIIIDNDYKGSAFTDDEGFFSFRYAVTDNEIVRDTLIIYILEDGEYVTNQSSTFAIRPTINFQVREVNTWKESFQIEAVLLNDKGRPMINNELTLTSNNRTLTMPTDSDGRVMFPVNLESRPENDLYRFSLTYLGTKYMIPRTVYDSVQLNPSINFAELFIGLLKLIAIIGLGYVTITQIRKHYPKNENDSEKSIVQSTQESQKIITGVYIVRAEKAKIEIKVPEIDETLPYVIGVNEPFTVNISLTTESCKTPCKIIIHGLNEPTEVTIRSDVAVKTIIIHDKEVKTIRFTYNDIETDATAETILVIRVVDYREEIVRQFNQDLQKQAEKQNEVTMMSTARELQLRLSNDLKEKSIESLEKLVHVFEEATYSLHPITHENYNEYMYSRTILEAETLAE